MIKSPGLLCRAILIISSGLVFTVSESAGQFPEFPPDDVTRTMDRDQMMWQLGISFPSLPPKLQDPRAPDNAWPADSSRPEGNWTDAKRHTITRSGFGLWNNYDDSKTGVYTPIDLLKMKDGTPVSTPEQWWNLRRPEIFREVSEKVWGVIPPDSILPEVTFSTSVSTEEGTGAVTGAVTGVKTGAGYIQKIITGSIDISRYRQVRNIPRIQATLRIPAGKEKPVPVMVVFGMGRWTPIDRYWEICSAHGWGVCIFECAALQPDNGAGLTSYIIGLCNKGNWRKPTDWGSLAAWSWGISKLIDYFEKDPDVDETMIGVTGHSRFGKATLVTMAYEPRVAIAFPSCSGSLGVKMNRRHWGQDLENSAWEQEYHWIAGNFFKWMGPLYDTGYLPRKCELMPVDAHSLLSLCAPRPIFVNGGVNDTWTDAYGMYLACMGATPVYELLGRKGLVMPDPEPQVDVAYISGDIGYRYHKEGHVDVPDWPAFFEFASKYITFQVDMKKAAEIGLFEPSSGDQVILRGSFNNWQGNDNMLNDAEPYGRYAEFVQPIPMAENHFTGNLYTLLDGYCGSTNGHFCALLKYHKIGKFIGTPSGATYKCNAGRDTEISLDHTRMILTFGRSTYSVAVTGMDKTQPIMPDFPVEVTYKDFLNGRDVFMEKAYMLIDHQNK